MRRNSAGTRSRKKAAATLRVSNDLRARQRVFRRVLFSWWKRHKLDYPWRSYSDPWRILLAETLLRKTNAEKVERLIPHVIGALPSPAAVLAISRNDLEVLLEPFGMQRRKAHELMLLAHTVMDRHGGQVPSGLAELKALPGVGDYIANAVLCFGFGKRRPIVDPNVIRVFARVFGFSSNRSRPRTDPELWRFAQALLPRTRYREYNWALLDLGKKLKSKPSTEGAWPQTLA
jgi:A/G-specific adenine glycosylase